MMMKKHLEESQIRNRAMTHCRFIQLLDDTNPQIRTCGLFYMHTASSYLPVHVVRPALSFRQIFQDPKNFLPVPNCQDSSRNQFINFILEISGAPVFKEIQSFCYSHKKQLNQPMIDRINPDNKGNLRNFCQIHKPSSNRSFQASDLPHSPHRSLLRNYTPHSQHHTHNTKFTTLHSPKLHSQYHTHHTRHQTLFLSDLVKFYS